MAFFCLFSGLIAFFAFPLSQNEGMGMHFTKHFFKMIKNMPSHCVKKVEWDGMCNIRQFLQPKTVY